MKIYGLGWVGSRTADFTAMREFVADTLGLAMTLDQKNAVVFSFPDGSAFEIFKPTDDDHAFFEHPVPGILVDDVREVRAELESRGVEFIGDVHDGDAQSWGTTWSHLRAPDGQIYVLISRPHHHPTAAVRAFEELRICLRVDDLDEAVRAYRDGLGMAVVDEWTHPGGQRGVLFGVVPAAVELFDGAQWDLVDDSETGQRWGTDHALRIEVRNRDEIETVARHLEDSGVTRTGDIVRTLWDQDCLRMSGGGDRQLTLFTLPEEERAVREVARSRLPY